MERPAPRRRHLERPTHTMNTSKKAFRPLVIRTNVRAGGNAGNAGPPRAAGNA